MATPNLAYQKTTCYHRHRMDPHGLDWANQPSPYKTYPDIPLVSLPEVQGYPAGDLRAAAIQPKPESPGTEINLAHLAQVLALGYSLTAGRRYQGEMFYFRSPASAGALYPTELYLAVNQVEGVSPGLYHYAIGQRALGCLRSGTFTNLRRHLFNAEPPTEWAAMFLITGRFFRSAWKYRTRAFRYVLLDGGHLAGNLGVALNALNLPWELHTDFDDEAVAQLLGIDLSLEGGLACITIPGPAGEPPISGSTSGSVSRPSSRLSGKPVFLEQEISFSANPLCSHELVDSKICDIYNAGGQSLAPQTMDFDMARQMGMTGSPGPSLTSGEKPSKIRSCAEIMLQRRSKRNFVDRAMEREGFDSLVEMVWDHYHGGAMGDLYQPRLLNLGILTGAVAGLAPGFYQLDSQEPGLKQIATGAYTDPMAAVCLNQAWLAQAGVHFVMTANLRALDTLCGPRGYRRAMIQAGSLGQVIYLAATALGLGACGIGAYYDHEARQLLSLAEDEFLLYLVAAGLVKK